MPTARELLEQAVRRYQNRAIETAQVIEELIQLAKDMRAAHARGEELNLSEDELAFYDALEVNDSAVKVLGEPTLVKIARELVETVKRNVTTPEGAAAGVADTPAECHIDANSRHAEPIRGRVPPLHLRLPP